MKFEIVKFYCRCKLMNISFQSDIGHQ